ncbi:MAG: ABC-type multidrug transport system, ATPase component [Haloplasmataceae bacterium]|jgi:ABC-2 type transport system ATP-binding protein|nr:ABC-type multidrug transport system, ATPase component [Haloplasmataceae bacterium]
MIKCKNLSFSYNKKDFILKNINFEISPNKISILLGNNGSGKTTLLNCIDGTYPINSGEITKNEESIFIKDNPMLYEYLTGKEYINLVLALNDNKNKNLADHLVKQLELENHLDKAIIDYSLGMKHKLALLTSVILEYKLLLIDEPLTALDPTTQRFMINHFKSMRDNGNTLIISTHMMHVAFELADVILILHDGIIHQVDNDFTTYQDFENYVLNQLSLNIENK